MNRNVKNKIVYGELKNLMFNKYEKHYRFITYVYLFLFFQRKSQRGVEQWGKIWNILSTIFKPK